MNDAVLIEDLRCLRMRLTPILSDQYKRVLKEAEKRLSSGASCPATNPVKLIKKRRPTKKELREFFNSKGL